MGVVDRFMNAFNGARLGWNGNRPEAIAPVTGAGYGDFAQRVQRYNFARAYYFNTLYDTLSLLASRLKSDERLYKQIRGIVNPVAEAVALYIAYTYLGSINTEDITKGALPLVYDNPAFEKAIPQVIKWSNLDQQLGGYVRDATLLGDSGWWVVDEPDKRRVRLERLEPDQLVYCTRDSVGNVQSAVFESTFQDNVDLSLFQSFGRSFTLPITQHHVKTTIITADSYRTFKDGQPFSFYKDSNAVPQQQWTNDAGFVPLKLVYGMEGVDGWGRPSFFGVAQRLIDELNDQASIVSDSVRKVVTPLLAAKGVSSAAEIKVNRDDSDRDSLAVLYLTNPQGSLEPIVIPVDLAAALSHAQWLDTKLQNAMAILTLSQIRNLRGVTSGVAIENMFGDAVSVVKQLRKNLDPGLAGALQMACTIGGMRGYDGFEGFNEHSYDAGNMELRIADRGIIDDTTTKTERLLALPNVGAQPTGIQKLMLSEMGYSEDQIGDATAPPPATPTQPSVTPGSMANAAAVWQKIGIPQIAPKPTAVATPAEPVKEAV